MTKIAHECPVSIFEAVQPYTDYDYFLVHLLDEVPEYKEKYFKAREKGREIILDNSIFELEQAFDSDKFAKKVKELNPTWYIIPDVLEDCTGTVYKGMEWLVKYKDLPGKRIGVVQGKNYAEIVDCYRFWDNEDIDMIAISFDYSYYEGIFPNSSKYVSWALGRVKLLGDLLKEGVINTDRKHHLLGASLPIEFKFLRMSNYNWIYSIDTSSPVVHAIKNIKYEKNFGLYTKESQKLFTMINYPSDKINKEVLYHNMMEFRKMVNG